MVQPKTKSPPSQGRLGQIQGAQDMFQFQAVMRRRRNKHIIVIGIQGNAMDVFERGLGHGPQVFQQAAAGSLGFGEGFDAEPV